MSSVPPQLRLPTGIASLLPDARFIGGCVRDAILNQPITDIDLATAVPPDHVIKIADAAGLRAIPTGLSHGTITVIAEGKHFEITTLRRDVRTDGRHAEVAWTTDWQEDAARRDFTINAMSLRPDGALFDYFGGWNDLHAGRVRFVGDPARRLAEDRLRVLRFFRFDARYGTPGRSDLNAVAAITASAHALRQLSVERIWAELKKILSVPDPRDTLRLMTETGVLGAILSEANPDQIDSLPCTANPLVRMAGILPLVRNKDDDALTVASRLKFSHDERRQLLALRHGPVPPADAHLDDLRRMLADDDANILIGRAALHHPKDIAVQLATMLTALQRPVFPVRGSDLIAIGFAPGPALGQLLADLRGWWVTDGCRADRATCLAELARKLMARAQT